MTKKSHQEGYNNMKNSIRSGMALVSMAAILVIAGCGCGSGGDTATTSGTDVKSTTTPSTTDKASGKVIVDGSSTVSPISQRMSEAFKEKSPDVEVPVGEKGTGSGMKMFIAGEIDVCDASRPIKAEEVADAKKAGLDFLELPIAFDGLSIIVNKSNTWLSTITVDELKKIWAPDSKIKSWKEVRAGFPDKPIALYGPATNHGTYEYFSEVIGGKATRQDYQQNQEYNALVQGVAADANALGYVGFAYYAANADKLKLVGVDSGKGAVSPTEATIADGSYAPMSRPLFIYVSKKALDKPAVKSFVEFYLDQAPALVKDAKYIPLPSATYDAVRARYKAMTFGTAFADVKPGMKLDDILAKENAAK